MGWQIVEQEEKVGKDDVRIVKCKQIKFFPSEKDGEVRFIPLRFKVLKVIIRSDNGVEHIISWSAYKGTPRFTYKWGIIGEKDDSFGPTLFKGWMIENRPSVAKEVFSAFDDRMAELKIGSYA